MQQETGSLGWLCLKLILLLLLLFVLFVSLLFFVCLFFVLVLVLLLSWFGGFFAELHCFCHPGSPNDLVPALG